MQNVSSDISFNNLKHSLETEDKQIRDIDNKIRLKEIDHHRAREAFDKIDREIQELHREKDILVHRRTQLETEIKSLQRSLDDLKRKGSSPLRF